MKKTYMTPEMLAVTLQQQDMLAESFNKITTGGSTDPDITYGGEDDTTVGGYDGGLAKGFTSQDLWNNEW
ncbi:MAG: hypothetical protein IKU02_07370 [Bacteroidaceae bacterium]|nr:hypothetical protein [Bacteroidaceae bacterium]